MTPPLRPEPVVLRYERPGKKKPWWRKLAIAAGIVVILAGLAAAILAVPRLLGPHVLVEPPRIDRGTSPTVVIRGTGTLTAAVHPAYAKEAGQIADMLFVVGMNVRVGQVIAHLQSRAEGLAAQRADSELTAVREAIVRQQIDSNGSRSALRDATARLAQANARVLAARSRLERRYVNAPINGRVVRRTSQLGDNVFPQGHPRAVPVALIMDPNTLRMEAEVRADSGALIRRGDGVRIRLDSVPRRWYTGSVLETSAGRGGAMRVLIQVDGADARSRPDLRGRVEVTAKTQVPVVKQRISVPAQALRRDAGQDVVWLLENGRIVRRAVDAAPDSAGRREIRAGLTGGELVVVQGGASLRPGEKVRAANARHPRP